jgi:hypothetical protein
MATECATFVRDVPSQADILIECIQTVAPRSQYLLSQEPAVPGLP